MTGSLGPGIVVHEYAPYLGCRLWGVNVHAVPVPTLLGGNAYVDHARIDSFHIDLTVAEAPLVVNSSLTLVSFGLALSVPPPATEIAIWVGTRFALTAARSRSGVAVVDV